MTSPLNMVQSWSFNPNISLVQVNKKSVIVQANLYVYLNKNVGMIQF
jgi:hypothetical protein